MLLPHPLFRFLQHLAILFALTIIAALSKGQMLMGIWMGLAGVLVALMGTFDDNNKLRLVPQFLVWV